jgi:predicted DNA-binding transcriptional regulator AlpA
MNDENQHTCRLLTRTDVESEYGIGKRYLEVAAMRREGPPFIKIGRSVRYRRSDIESWISSRRVRTEDPLGGRP